MAKSKSVVLHHPQAIPGFTIKTRDGVHYTYDSNCEIEIPGHLAHVEGHQGQGHVAELTHSSRGHRHGPHPDRVAEGEPVNINPSVPYEPPK